MTDWSNKINRLIKIMLDLANISDEEKETPFDRKMGLGYRAFTSYIRNGCKEIIDLQDNYYSALESKDYAERMLKSNEEFIERIFGDLNVTEFNDEEIARIKAVVDAIEKEWEEEDEDSN